jgi:hypothetical protein
VQEIQEALSDVAKLKLKQHFFDPSRRSGQFGFNPEWPGRFSQRPVWESLTRTHPTVDSIHEVEMTFRSY